MKSFNIFTKICPVNTIRHVNKVKMYLSQPKKKFKVMNLRINEKICTQFSLLINESGSVKMCVYAIK